MRSGWPLTVRGTGAIVLAFVCLILAQRLGLAELVYLAALLVVVVGASITTLYLVRRSATVTRSFSPDVAEAGGAVHVRLRVRIRTRLPVAQGRWRDALPDGVTGDATGVFPATRSGLRDAGGGVELAYDVTAQRRGIRSLGPLSVGATDPFGFARRRHTIGRPLPLTVTPAIVDLGPLADQPGETGGSLHSSTDQLGQGTDNLVPRHYVPGDSMRRIHWRASAHRDELMVRQEEQETTPEATVVLDRSTRRWTSAAARATGGDPDFETAVSACASIAVHLAKEGYLVSVVDLDGAVLTDPIDGDDSAAIERLAIDLATVTAHRDLGPDALATLYAGQMTGPLIYVTGRLTSADVIPLRTVAHHSSQPIILSMTTEGEPVPTELAALGWRVAEVAAGGDLGAAWTAVADRGARRVGA